MTLANKAIFDADNAFAGCIPGISYILKRQGLMDHIGALDPADRLSPGQAEQIDQIIRLYPHLTDDEFVRANLRRLARSRKAWSLPGRGRESQPQRTRRVAEGGPLDLQKSVFSSAHLGVLRGYTFFSQPVVLGEIQVRELAVQFPRLAVPRLGRLDFVIK